MADTDTPQGELNPTVTVEDAGPSLKKLHIEVSADVVDDKLSSSIDTITVEAELPGFRKGRAPRRLVEKKFGSLIQNEAKQQLVATSYQEALDQHKLKVIGEPRADELDKAELKEGTPLTFTVEVEVQPEFELPEIEGIEVLKPAAEVTDEQVDSEVEKIRINEGDLEERDAPEAGDYITGNGKMVGPGDDGEEKVYYDINDAVVRVPLSEDEGKGMILGVLVDDFEKQLGAPKAGESVTITTKGPELHEREELRGKDLTVTFEVTRIDRIIPAELADVVARTGFESEDQLKEAVKTRLSQRALVSQATAMRQQIAKHLSDNVEMELPERTTAGQAERILERRRMELMYRGVDPSEIETHMAELRASSATAAQGELKLFFILNEAAEKLDVKVEEAEINGRIAQMAAERGQRPEMLRQELMQTRRITQVFQQLREHKTMDAILAKAKIEEVSVDEFNERVKDAG
ncbi:MAG: trigger factor [Planctomycetota bacterium]